MKRLKDAWRLLNSKYYYVLMTETESGKSYISSEMPEDDAIEFTGLVHESLKKQRDNMNDALDILTGRKPRQ